MNNIIDNKICSFNNFQVNYDSFLIFNDNNFLKGNIINANESEDISNVKKYNLLSKKIKRDNKNIIDLTLQDNLEYNISGNKEKKIFEIEHIKRKIKYESKINNQKKNELKAIVKKEEEKFNKNNSLNENLKILENSKDTFIDKKIFI